MNFKEMFLEINTNQENEILSQIREFFVGDTQYMKLKKKAKQSKDNVPDFLDYVYTVYEKQIDKISSKYKIDYDQIAQLFLAA